MRHRLFVAATPPAKVRAALIAAMGGVPHARWQTDEQLHITLRFIGAVDRHQAEDIAAALGTVRHAAMLLELGEGGTFDRQGRIDTLWVGIRPRDPITRLHDRIDRALGDVGVVADTRAFLPHVTIARFARGTAPAASIVPHVAVPMLPAFRIERFTLFESHLGAGGASYEAIEHYRLGG